MCSSYRAGVVTKLVFKSRWKYNCYYNFKETYFIHCLCFLMPLSRHFIYDYVYIIYCFIVLTTNNSYNQ
jgi:hypothetical protein